MKTIEIDKPASKPKMGEYLSIEELVNAKLKKAAQTLNNIDLKKINKSDWTE
jgi:hypothetical protein